MNEYYEFRSKRIKELDETFEITHFYGDDYPENINVEVNKIINNEWKLNNLQFKIDKAIEYIENNSYFKDNVVKTMIFKDYSNGILDILKEQ